MQIEAEPKDGYVLVRMSGMMPAGSFMENLLRFMGIVKDSGVKRVLIDEAGLDFMVDMLEAYELGESSVITEAATEGYRFASVPAPGNRDRNRVLETVMQNRSVSYRVFDSLSEAKAWLLS